MWFRIKSIAVQEEDKESLGEEEEEEEEEEEDYEDENKENNIKSTFRCLYYSIYTISYKCSLYVISYKMPFYTIHFIRFCISCCHYIIFV